MNQEDNYQIELLVLAEDLIPGYEKRDFFYLEFPKVFCPKAIYYIVIFFVNFFSKKLENLLDSLFYLYYSRFSKNFAANK